MCLRNKFSLFGTNRFHCVIIISIEEQQSVALKIIDIKQIKEKYVIKNLHREARIMSTLNHPCIAALFQTMQMDDNIYYLVTELVSGGDLCSFIIGQRYGKLEERSARVFARQFASALAHMHSFGIVHRDLKMENVILNSAQTQIKIVDFGLSNVWSNNNPLRTHCGSPEYAAPELFIAGKEYGPEVDLWSLGIIFYGMVVGQLPFVGGRKNQLSSQERRKRLVAQINKGLGATQRQAIASFSPELRTMLNKLLAADPAKRITTKELLLHPWITEKGRKIIRKHPFKELDNVIRTKIAQQLCKFFETDEDTVFSQIQKNSFGRLGGMYNILKHQHLIEQFSMDHITSSATRSNKLEVSPVKTLTNSPTLAKSQHTIYNQCIVLLNQVSKQQVQTRAKSANQAIPLSKNYSKLSRCKMDLMEGNLPKHNHSKTNSIVINRKIQESSIPIQTALKKSNSSKLQMANNRPLSASNTKRPHTTGIMRNTSKLNKRGCVSAAPQKTPTTDKREFQHQQICVNPAAMGDGYYLRKRPSNEILRKQRSKDPLANEPIARSIAGYLVKNVPNYMFQRMRK